jgi:peptidyl-prolyl cis-trans isomerase D
MLQGVRDHLKGTLVFVVVLIFIVPMVISGVGSSYLGGAVGTDVAEVNGEAIAQYDLDRRVQQRRQQLVSEQNVDVNDDRVSDEKLRPEILESLTRRAALVTSAKEAGMWASEDEFRKVLQAQQSFFVDGKFSQEQYTNLLSAYGYTPALFKKEVMDDIVLQQQNGGLNASAFVTPAELQQVVSILDEQRSFWTVKIPRTAIASDVEVTDSDLQSFYEENQERYAVPEKIKVEYLELSIDVLAEQIDVEESDIRAQYDQEIANFVSDETFVIAHILFEDSQSDGIAEVQSKLDSGEDFAALASEYSDDIITSDDGGELGVLVAGVYPSNFEEAVYALEEGQVSAPIETEDGVHFVKVLEKRASEYPSYEERRATIKSEVAKVRARDGFLTQSEQLADITFSSEGLSEAATQLGLTVQESAYFDRQTGSGIAENASVRNAAFSDEVYKNGHNSNLVTVSDGYVVVVRVADKQDAYVKSLEDVKQIVEFGARSKKVQEALEEKAKSVGEQLIAGDDPEVLSKTLSFEYSQHENVKRTSPELNPELRYFAFGEDKLLANGELIQTPSADGFWLIGVTSIAAGKLEDLDENIVRAYESQLMNQYNGIELSAYEEAVVASSDIKIK